MARQISGSPHFRPSLKIRRHGVPFVFVFFFSVHLLRKLGACKPFFVGLEVDAEPQIQVAMLCIGSFSLQRDLNFTTSSTRSESIFPTVGWEGALLSVYLVLVHRISKNGVQRSGSKRLSGKQSWIATAQLALPAVLGETIMTEVMHRFFRIESSVIRVVLTVFCSPCVDSRTCIVFPAQGSSQVARARPRRTVTICSSHHCANNGLWTLHANDCKLFDRGSHDGAPNGFLWSHRDKRPSDGKHRSHAVDKED